MWEAIHKKTGVRYPAGAIWLPGLFEQPDPHKEDWICPKDYIINLSDFPEDAEFKVGPWGAHKRDNGEFVRPHFKHTWEYKNVSLIHESDEHIQKCEVMNRILFRNDPFYLKYSEDVYCNKDVPIDIEQIKKGIKLQKVIKTMKEQKKEADVLIPFVFSAFWGNGIVIEIRVTETEKTQNDKEEFWLFRGYSIAWVDKKDFVTVGDGWALKENFIEVLPFSTGNYSMQMKVRNDVYGYLHKAIEQQNKTLEKIDDKIKELYGDTRDNIRETARLQSFLQQQLNEMKTKVFDSIRTVFSEEHKKLKDTTLECISTINQNKLIDKEEIQENILKKLEDIPEKSDYKETIVPPVVSPIETKQDQPSEIIDNTKETHIELLNRLVDGIKKNNPTENVIVDEKNKQIVWGVKQ